MKKETKEDIKDTFDNWLVVAVCIALVASLNKSCSRLPEKFESYKTEIKDSINIQQQKIR